MHDSVAEHVYCTFDIKQGLSRQIVADDYRTFVVKTKIRVIAMHIYIHT